MPFALADRSGGQSLRFGFEKKLAYRISLYNELGTYLPAQAYYSRVVGLRIREEIRFYDKHPKRNRFGYWGFSTMYKYQQLSVKSPEFTLEKNVYAFGIPLGFITTFSSTGFFVDLSVITGIRIKEAHALAHPENSPTAVGAVIWGQPVYFALEEGSRSFLDLQFSLKFGWAAGRKNKS